MKAISNGNRYDIFDDNLKTYDKLPSKVYKVKFNKMSGFYLELHQDIDIKEDKIYGNHEKKVAKVLNAFKSTNRNLGVILSGNKGMGKSLFAKILSIQAIKEDIPVIIVDSYIPGIASYIEEITQEVMVLFDEFDKTFGEIKTSDTALDPQTELLTLFDGISQGKKLYVVTCNEIKRLNDCLINRPGRFHYHLRFEYPTDIEIKEYLQDKLKKEYYGEIEEVIKFSKKVNLNYDCLRAIATELNFGYSFKEAIGDLNIVNLKKDEYHLTLIFKNGKKFTRTNAYIDLFNPDKEEVFWLDSPTGESIVMAQFKAVNCEYNPLSNEMYISADKIIIDYDTEYHEEYQDLYDELKSVGAEKLIIKKANDNKIHYLV